MLYHDATQKSKQTPNHVSIQIQKCVMLCGCWCMAMRLTGSSAICMGVVVVRVDVDPLAPLPLLTDMARSVQGWLAVMAWWCGAGCVWRR